MLHWKWMDILAYFSKVDKFWILVFKVHARLGLLLLENFNSWGANSFCKSSPYDIRNKYFKEKITSLGDVSIPFKRCFYEDASPYKTTRWLYLGVSYLWKISVMNLVTVWKHCVRHWEVRHMFQHKMSFLNFSKSYRPCKKK